MSPTPGEQNGTSVECVSVIYSWWMLVVFICLIDSPVALHWELRDHDGMLTRFVLNDVNAWPIRNMVVDLPPPPLRLPEKLRLAEARVGLGDSEMTLLRGLNASGLASLCLRSLSSVVRARGSLLARKLWMAASINDLRTGRNLSGVLREPVDFCLA